MIRMTDRRIVKRVVRTTRVSAEEAQRLNEIRRQAMEEFPPVESPPGIPARIRAARRAKKLTWRAVAQAAGLSGPNVVRDLELGHNAQASDVEAVARVLDLTMSTDQLTCEVEVKPGETFRLPAALAERVGPGHWLVTITPLPATEMGDPGRDHAAFLNSYLAEDQGLYDDDPAR
jgi:transcriptional regulator with XRE-family HTH domain